MKLRERILTNFGLSENEIKVYLECLKEKDLGPFKLAKLTGIPRTTVYELLTSLSLKGLVELEQSDGLTKQQTKVTAKNPTTIREIIRAKKRRLSQLEVDVVGILPMLNQDYFKDEANADFQFFPGIEGAKKVYFSETVSGKQPILVFDNFMPANVFGQKEVNDDVSKTTEKRLKAHQGSKELGILNEWSKHVLSYQVGRDENYLSTREVRLIDMPGVSINQTIIIQGNWIKIACAKEEEAWGIIIRSESLATTVKSIFDLVWPMGKIITVDSVKSWGEECD